MLIVKIFIISFIGVFNNNFGHWFFYTLLFYIYIEESILIIDYAG